MVGVGSNKKYVRINTLIIKELSKSSTSHLLQIHWMPLWLSLPCQNKMKLLIYYKINSLSFYSKKYHIIKISKKIIPY